MILSDLWIRSLSPGKLSRPGKERKILGVRPLVLLPFLIGACAGFPLGIKCLCDLYDEKKITYQEAVYASCFCNNTGPAFIVIGVGHMLGDAAWGWKLYGIQIGASILCALLFRTPLVAKCALPPPTSARSTAAPQRMGAGGAVQRAALGTLYVCGYVTIFSVLTGMLKSLLPEYLLWFIFPFLEISGAASMAAAIYATHPKTGILLLSTAINFAGVSVHLQSGTYLHHAKLPTSYHTAAKLLQAVIADLITLILLHISP